MAEKRYKRTRASGKYSPLLSIALIALVLVGGWYLGKYLGWWGATAAVTEPADAWTFHFTNSTGDALDDDEVLGNLWYYDASDIDEFDDDDWNALAGSDLTLDDDTLEYGETLIPKAGYYYWIEINGTGYNTQWMYLSAYALGDINVTLLPTPDDDSFGMASEDDDTAIADMTGNSLLLIISFLDENDDPSDDVGYRTTIDYEEMTSMEDCDDAQTYNIIRFEVNETVADGDIEYDSTTEVDVVISGVYVYFLFTEDFTGLMWFDFDISTNLGDTFEMVAATIRHGTVASNTQIAALA